MSRKTFTAEFKLKVAIEAIKAARTINEIASEFDLHPTQVNGWKKQLIDGGKAAFSNKKAQKVSQEMEKERERLYAQIGKLKVEVDWLKKKTGHLD